VHLREEEQLINQAEPQPGRVLQAMLAIAFLGFIIALPTIIEKLGK
jgi:hypothetical protein